MDHLKEQEEIRLRVNDDGIQLPFEQQPLELLPQSKASAIDKPGDPQSLIANFKRKLTLAPKKQRLELASFMQRVQASVIDNFLLAWAGGIIVSLSTFLLDLPFIDLSVQSVTTLAQSSLLIGISGAFIYWLYSIFPFVIPIIFMRQWIIAKFSIGSYVLMHACPEYINIASMSTFPFQLAANASTFVIIVLPLLLAPMYYALMESSPTGATLGKLLVGAKITASDGRPITFVRAVLRQLASVFNLFFYGLSYLAVLLPWKRAIQDILTGTYVVPIHGRLLPTNQTSKKVADEIVIRYHSYPVIERWLRQRFNWIHSKQKVTRKSIAMLVTAPLVVSVALPVLGIALVWLMNQFHFKISGDYRGPQAASESGLNLVVIMGCFAVVGLLFSYAAEKYRRKPNGLALGVDGLHFIYPNLKSDQPIHWSDIDRIRLEEGKNSTVESVVVFYPTSGSPLRINLDCIESVDEKELILRAIETWAPSVDRDANIIQALQPPADYSYTELWLQALTAPPKRERLKPLVESAVLKDGTYKVLRALGAGGQGFAYSAVDQLTNDIVVLKEFILPVFVDIMVRKRALEKFETEGKMLKQLDHEKIVKLNDFFVEDHRAYLVLEHIDGDNLREIVKKTGPMPEAQVKSLAMQLCEILGYLHGLTPPVVHRDITPDNLILRKDGTLKLIDFTVANKSDSSTTTGSVVGKHAYLPPEQFRGQTVPESDIYSCGATLYYLLTGHDPDAISISHPRKDNANISESLDALVAKATALTVESRYRSIGEVAQGLASV